MYQRQTRFNRSADPTLLAIASTSGHLHILSFPDLEQVYCTNVEQDIFSLTFSPADNDTVSLDNSHLTTRLVSSLKIL
jgi:hypothetical protein